jgi:hypothetical protein
MPLTGLLVYFVAEARFTGIESEDSAWGARLVVNGLLAAG